MDGVGLAAQEDEELTVTEELLSAMHGGGLDKPGIGFGACRCIFELCKRTSGRR